LKKTIRRGDLVGGMFQELYFCSSK